jgi:hypothetical protein
MNRAEQELNGGVPYTVNNQGAFKWYDHPGIPTATLPHNPMKNAVRPGLDRTVK